MGGWGDGVEVVEGDFYQPVRVRVPRCEQELQGKALSLV